MTVPLNVLGIVENNYLVIASLERADYLEAEPDEFALTVFNPAGSFFTGGGYILDPATGLHNNFGFTFKYKSGRNFQGNLVSVIRDENAGTKTRIKSNSLATAGYPAGNPPGTPTAAAGGKCNIEVRDLRTEALILGSGNLSFYLTVEDRGPSGVGEDTFRLELNSADGVPYYPGHMPRKELLRGGNLVIHK